MQVHHDEGAANRIAPESCADARIGPVRICEGARGNSRPYRDQNVAMRRMSAMCQKPTSALFVVGFFQFSLVQNQAVSKMQLAYCGAGARLRAMV